MPLKNERMDVRCSPAQKATIMMAADRAGMSGSAYMLTATFEKIEAELHTTVGVDGAAASVARVAAEPDELSDPDRNGKVADDEPLDFSL